MQAETEKRFKVYCMEKKITFAGLPVVQDKESTPEYKEHFS